MLLRTVAENAAPRQLSVYVDCNLMPALTDQSFYEVTLRAVLEAVKQLGDQVQPDLVHRLETLCHQVITAERAIVPPQLDVTRTGSNTIISWPAVSTNFLLQARTNFAASAWTNWPSPPSLVSNRFVVTDADAGTNKFYRLRNSSGAGP